MITHTRTHAKYRTYILGHYGSRNRSIVSVILFVPSWHRKMYFFTFIRFPKSQRTPGHSSSVVTIWQILLLLQHFTRELTKLTTFKLVVIISARVSFRLEVLDLTLLDMVTQSLEVIAVRLVTIGAGVTLYQVQLQRANINK